MKIDYSEFWLAVTAWIIGLGVLGGLATFAYQAYWWLRMSYWFPISVITGLKWLAVDWAKAPWDWLGLHALLNFIPLSLAIPIVGLILAAIVIGAIKE